VQTNTHPTRTKFRAAIAAAAVASAAALAAAALGAGADSPRAAPTADPGDICEPWGDGKRVAIATAKLIVEYNATDQDIGVHGAFDDQGWSKLCVYAPNGDPVLRVSPKSQLKDLTMAGIFFESREPPIDEFSFADLKARFPEGRYEVRGLSFDGKRLVGQATFTHDVPAAPTVTAPLDGAEVDPNDLTVTWEDVTQTVDGDPVTITGYEVIITKERHVDPHGFSQPIYDVHVPPDRNSLSVPVEFLEPGTEYELEVLALERSGNQTISVSFFTTA
jgi:Fibronectin type III domain